MSDGKPVRVIEHVRIADIDIPEGRRKLRYENARRMQDSLSTIGLQTPITVRYLPDRPSVGGTDDSFVLVTGHHRLDAARALGWEKIECFVVGAECDELTAEMVEIAENLHRTELSQLERSEQIARWVKLSRQHADRPTSDDNALQPATHKNRGQQPGGINEAARKLGVEQTEAHRAVKIDGLHDDAKAAARDAGLDDNKSALLAAAKETEPAKQVEALKQRAAKPDKVDPKLAAQMKARATHEIGLLVVTYMQADMIPALIANLNIGGGPADIIAAIKNAEAKKR